MHYMDCINSAVEVGKLAEELNLKSRLKTIGKTQGWLITELRKYDISVSLSEMSYIVNGIMTTPKARRVLETADEIIKEFE